MIACCTICGVPLLETEVGPDQVIVDRPIPGAPEGHWAPMVDGHRELHCSPCLWRLLVREVA